LKRRVLRMIPILRQTFGASSVAICLTWPCSADASCFYFSRLISVLRAIGASRFPDDLAAYHKAFVTQANEIAGVATESTLGFAERTG
jgi:hypothetical protein